MFASVQYSLSTLSLKYEVINIRPSLLLLLHRGNMKLLCKFTILRLVDVESLHQYFNGIYCTVRLSPFQSYTFARPQGMLAYKNVLCLMGVKRLSGKWKRMEVSVKM